jgi:hypothetical protein
MSAGQRVGYCRPRVLPLRPRREFFSQESIKQRLQSVLVSDLLIAGGFIDRVRNAGTANPFIMI